MLAAVFLGSLLGPIGNNIYAIEHPQMLVVQGTTAQSHRIDLQPAGSFFIPGATNRNTLAQQAAGPSATARFGAHSQWTDQAVQSAGTGSQQNLAYIGIYSTMIGFVGG